MSDSIIVQQPVEAPQHLFLLLHGVRGSPNDMRRLGERIAMAFPQAWVGCACGPESCEPERGYRWFGTEGLDEGNRAERVRAAVAAFHATLGEWQRHTGIGPAATTLIGFSQGAVIALEATRDPAQRVAARVVAIAGRYAAAPEVALPELPLHFVHGTEDDVVSCDHSVEAAERVAALGGVATSEIVPGAGHVITRDVMDAVMRCLPGACEWPE